MTSVRGSEGYERSVERFVELSQSLSFDLVCRDFLDFLPEPPARLLDAGSGAGQNAAALSGMGYEVVAVEPVEAFLEAARAAYRDRDVLWLNDSLPELATISPDQYQFDFILVEGVWHHLSVEERLKSLGRFWSLLRPEGECALSLRNGPAGMGTRVFPTSVRDTVEEAESLGLECVFRIEDQPSILGGKEDVTWSRIVLRKVADT